MDCAKLFHHFRVKIECNECGRKAEKELEYRCETMTQSYTVHRVGCANCRNKGSYALLYFSCEAGSTDYYNFGNWHKYIAGQVENIDS